MKRIKYVAENVPAIETMSFNIEQLSKNDNRLFGKKDKESSPSICEIEFKKLEESLFERKIIIPSGASAFYINRLVGRVVEFKGKNNYEPRFLDCMFDSETMPEVKVIDSKEGTLFSSKIHKNLNLNFNVLTFLGIKFDISQLIELTVKDESCCYINNNQISKEKIKETIKKIPDTELDNYSLILSVLTTTVEHRIFNSTELKLNVETTYITAGGKAFSSNDSFSRKRQFSIEIIPLKDII